MVTIALLLLLALALAAVVYFATRATRTAAEATAARGDAEMLRAERDALQAQVGDMQPQIARLVEKEKEVAVADAVLKEKDEEIRRLRAAHETDAATASEQQKRLEVFAERLKHVQDAAQGAATKSDAARAGSERVEDQLLGFTRRIANPQSRGAFGEEALRNQLEMLGLSEGRDFDRQVRVLDGRRRIDYAVHLRGTTIGLDPKFALDPDLDGLSEALAAGDDARLLDFAKKLVARARELAAKDYWAHIEKSPSFVLMYVPIEGAQEALRAMPKFSYEKFAMEHGVYIVTPLQLGTTLGVIADVAHLSRREDELEAVTRELTALAGEMSKFCEHYHKHGKQIAAVARSYNDGAAMLSSRGGLGRIARRSMGFARRLFSMPDEAEIPEVRDDCGDMGREYGTLVEESTADAA